MLAIDMEEIKNNNDAPFEKSIKAFLETLTSKTVLFQNIEKAEESNKRLTEKYKYSETLTMTEAEEFAGISDLIENYKAQQITLAQRHKENETALAGFFEKIHSKKVAYAYDEMTYEIQYSVIKGIQCRKMPV